MVVEDNTSEQQFGVFKDFDFLDVELEDAEVRLCNGSFIQAYSSRKSSNFEILSFSFAVSLYCN